VGAPKDRSPEPSSNVQYCLGGAQAPKFTYSIVSEAEETSGGGRAVRKAGWDLGRFRDKLNSSATTILKGFPKRGGEDENSPICYYMAEGRVELRRLLIEDEEGFIGALISQGMRLAELAPIVTQVLAGRKK
jgi:hypothetical protein